tara:strand:- start:4128 stop:5090 length:963 start_codon:yes stop_codon:yes gene_type:complete
MPDFKILITGGLGYLGGRIADFLKRNHPQAIIILGTSRKIFKKPDWAKSFQIAQFNLLDSASIDKAITNDINAIIHLAALNEHDSYKDIKIAWETNTLGTQNLLSIANKKQVENFIYFSTVHVYGNCKGKITENSPTKPHHPYAATHRAAEDMVRFFQYYKGMNTLTFRLSNGYGYPMDLKVNRWTLVFNDLCQQAMTQGKMVIHSSGQQHRDFISLYDVAAAVDHFLYVIPDKWEDGLFNLGGEGSLSIEGLAKQISKVYKKKYGNAIAIEVLGGNNTKVYNSPVDFNIDKLKKTGFRLTGNMVKEIDKTLSLCEKFSA